MANRKSYTKEFKLEACKLVVEKGYSYAEAAQRLDVSFFTLKEWVKRLRASGQLPPASEPLPEAEELRALRKENQRLQMEVEILKKAAAYFAKESL